MTDTRTLTVANRQEYRFTVDDLTRDGYTQVDDEPPTFVRYDRGSLLAHLALFFTVGFWTLGIVNAIYAWYRKRKSHDRVRVVTEYADDRPEFEGQPMTHGDVRGEYSGDPTAEEQARESMLRGGETVGTSKGRDR